MSDERRGKTKDTYVDEIPRSSEITSLELVNRLSRDLRQAARELSREDVRYVVDLYYSMQDYRKKATNQERAAGDDREPHRIVTWAAEQFSTMEKQVERFLEVFALHDPVGAWSLGILGIGPVIASGLLAHIDVERGTKRPGCDCSEDEKHRTVVRRMRKARKLPVKDPICGGHPVETVGQIWRFAGLDPTVRWEKGKFRPWNARLKVLCWKIGESFVKVHKRPTDVYGRYYVERKELEAERNARGEYADQAAALLATRRYGDNATRAHLEAGRLSPDHLHSRAKRYAVKLFLSHWHHVSYWERFAKAPPKPYVITHGGHAHFVEPPHWKPRQGGASQAA